MRGSGITTLVGGLLIVAGVVILISGGSFSTRKEVAKIGDLKLTTKDDHSIPPWAAGAGIAVGVVLVVAGMRTRN